MPAKRPQTATQANQATAKELSKQLDQDFRIVLYGGSNQALYDATRRLSLSPVMGAIKLKSWLEAFTIGVNVGKNPTTPRGQLRP